MNILVCIKQVPDMESKFKVDGAGRWYDGADLAWRMNEYDEYAVEQAVQLKEKTGADLTVLCIGPERVKETMKKALAMGCDRGVHVADEASSTKDPFSIASIIAEVGTISTTIAASIEQQGAATHEISRNAQEAAGGTGQVTNTITGVTEGAGETGRVAHSVLQASASLTRQADALRQDVGRFLAEVRAA